MGALTGATIAFINNKERVLEVAEEVLRKSADFCKEKLEESRGKKIYFAAAHEDNSFSGVSSGYEDRKFRSVESDIDEATTPDISDNDELDLESLD